MELQEILKAGFVFAGKVVGRFVLVGDVEGWF